MIHLDYFANYPINKQACEILSATKLPNTNPFSLADSKHNKAQLELLKTFFEVEFVQFFGCSKEDFITLFLQLGSKEVYLMPSFSQQAYKSLEFITEINKLRIDSLADFTPKNSDKTCYVFAPYVNEDILTYNDFSDFMKKLDSLNVVLFVEISRLLQNADIQSLQKLRHKRVVFVLNAESIGLPRRYGIVAHSIPKLTQIFDSLNPNGFFEALNFTLQKIANDSILRNYLSTLPNVAFYKALQAQLGQNVSLFAPLSSCPPNAVALRLFGAKARILAQNLLIENLSVINGQECLLGNFKPSFVLNEMGYKENECRELLSISFAHLSQDTLNECANKIARAYTSLKALEI